MAMFDDQRVWPIVSDIMFFIQYTFALRYAWSLVTSSDLGIK